MEEKIAMLHQELCEARDAYEAMLTSLIGKRELLIWGAISRNDVFLDFAKRYQVKVAGYIDSSRDTSQFNGYQVWHPDTVQTSARFILVGLNNLYSDVLEVLHRWGKAPIRDYLYLSKYETVITQSNGIFSDFHGNKIQGMVDGFQVHLSSHSVLIIGSGCKIDSSVDISLGESSILIVGDNCVVDKNVRLNLYKYGAVYIGNGSLIQRDSRFACDQGVVCVGDGCSFGENTKAFVGHKSRMIIHDDCMLSSDIILQGHDAHQFFDLERRKNINRSKSYEIEIGKHVWIGRRCNILYGAHIGDGSVIGMGSLVCKSVPKNVIAVGNPLNISRKNVAWRRVPTWPFLDDKSYFEGYDFVGYLADTEDEAKDENR